jgi:valyl-tRNA synthetase
MQIHVVLEGILDKATEMVRISKELAEAEKFAVAISGKLSNESFVARAKPEVVDAEREKLANQLDRVRIFKETLTDLAG